jgi:outer membrane protein TolC
MGNNLPDNPFYSYPDRDMSVQITAAQILYAGGRIRKSRDLENHLNVQADMTEQIGARDIRKQTQTAFDAVLVRQAAVDILKDRMKQRQNELEDAKDLREAGMVTSLDVRQAQLILNLAEEELHAAETGYHESLIDFNLTIGRPCHEPYLVPDGRLEDSDNVTSVLDRLYEKFAADHLIDVRWAKSQVDASRSQYEIARGAYLPEVAVAATGKSDGGQINDMNESWAVGVQAKWDIFDGGLIRAKAVSAKSDMKTAQENLNRTRRILTGDIEKIRANINTLNARIALQKESVILSGQNYEDARGHYRAGMITLTQVGDFNLAYAEARFNLLRLYFLQREQVIRAEALAGG